MRKLFSGLVLLVAACARARAESPASDWPAGSKVIGSVCFEHASAPGWEPAQLRLADGALPVRGSPISGAAYFPMDAGQLRLRACP